MAVRPYPGLDDVIAFCRREEAGSKFATAKTGVNQVSGSRRRQSRGPSGSRERHQPKRSPSNVARGHNVGGKTCERCGRRPHMNGQQCPAANVVCHECHVKGHFEKHCLSKQRTYFRDEHNCPEEKSGVGLVNVLAVQNVKRLETTPHVNVSLRLPDNTNVFNVSAIPDSGSPANIMSETIFQSMCSTKNVLKRPTCSLVTCERALDSYRQFSLQVQNG